MPKFSKTSLKRLETCHPILQELCHEAIKDIDFMVICGHRGEEEQNKAFAEGKSKLKYPHSKHNKIPSLAVDLCPVKYEGGKVVLDWDNTKAFKVLAMHLINQANNKGYPLEWGGLWPKFKDMPHFQLNIKEQLQ